MEKVVLITGASSGIGRASAQLFLRHGYRVVATARKTTALADLQKAGCLTIELDVTNEASMQRAVQQILAQTSPIDVLVNNAGYGLNGPIEELSPEQLRNQFDTNVFGLVRLCQLVLPTMRAQRLGRIINVGSVGGDVTFPGAGAYHASKYALEALTDAMRYEVKPFGVSVSLIKPGGVRTNFIDNNIYPADVTGAPYAYFKRKMKEEAQKMFEANSAWGILTPGQVAQAIF